MLVFVGFWYFLFFFVFFFFFNDTATTEIYTLSLHDALQISSDYLRDGPPRWDVSEVLHVTPRSEEHTSELQSHVNLVCRLLLEKKKKKQKNNTMLKKKKKKKK